MTKTIVYCDYNAAAPVRPEAALSVARALQAGGNASSVHSAGRRLRAMIEDAREVLAKAVNARADNVIFTSGATEALHLAMASAGTQSLVIGATEHDAVFEEATRAMRADRIVAVDADGVIDLGALEALLAHAPKPALLCIQLANNETGVIQPIAKIAALARSAGALVLVDGAQGFGRLGVDIAALDASYLVVSSHKIGGPSGAGALILAPGAPFAIRRFGGGQEGGRRPGSENPAAIAGFGAAIAAFGARFGEEVAMQRMLRDRFEAGLTPERVIFGAAANRLANTSNFALPGLIAETAVIAMDLEGVAVSSGAACSSGKVRTSRVLAAMGASPDLAKAALRVSFGWNSTDADVEACLAALNKIAARRSLRGAA